MPAVVLPAVPAGPGLEEGLAARVAAGPGLWEDEEWLSELRRDGLVSELLADGVLARAAAEGGHGCRIERALTAAMILLCLVTGALYQDAELGYAVTDHTAQGRTVHTGLAVITGTEDRQHAYVALTRGTDINMAYVFTVSPKLADPAPGPRPAPALARYDRIATASSGEAVPLAPPEAEDALGVLSGVLENDGQQLSATQTRRQALADADHLAVLNAIWTAETTPARHQRYHDLYLAALPPGYQHEPGHQAKWLWRTLRAAELAGLDPAEALAAAIAERDLVGARDVPSVIDSRLRRRFGSLTPRPAAPGQNDFRPSPPSNGPPSPPRSPP